MKFIEFVFFMLIMSIFTIQTSPCENCNEITYLPNIKNNYTTTEPTNPAEPTTPKPLPIQLKGQDIIQLNQEWIWICQGAIAIIDSTNKRTDLFDNSSTTGLITVINQNIQIKITGPKNTPQDANVALCYPKYQSEKESFIDERIKDQLNFGCGSKCRKIHIVELIKDHNNIIINDYWRP